MIYCTSDTHFGHKKVCYGYDIHFDTVRDYATVEEMEQSIIDTWNDIVEDDDEVIFLGDFILGCQWEVKKQRIIELWNKLNGKKTWIVGNHDEVILKHKDEFPDIQFLDRLDMEIDGVKYHFQHIPFNEEDMVEDEVYVHGHTHSTNPWNGKQNCVCWDAWYAPTPVDILKTPSELVEANNDIEEFKKELYKNG